MMILALLLQINFAGSPMRGHVASWNEVLFYGDSKTWLNTCQPYFARLSNAHAGYPATIQIAVSNVGITGTVAIGGSTVTSMLSRQAADLASIPTQANPKYVLMNLGINEVISGIPAEATWKANALSLVDGLRTRWPVIQVYWMRVWRQGAGYQADIATINGYIEWVPTQRSWVHLGPDERVWAENGDDGATMFYDGLHYSDAGALECANQWLGVLGWD